MSQNTELSALARGEIPVSIHGEDAATTARAAKLSLPMKPQAILFSTLSSSLVPSMRPW